MATVHPRVRGDRLSRSSGSIFAGGSPPRARGQATILLGALSPLRFTPACAGTGWRIYRAPPFIPVHPRVRGDRRLRRPRRRALPGSPPRARGQARWARWSAPQGRFTPACAGTGVCAFAFLTRFSVHPRVRGDRVLPTTTSSGIFGSPPRARGQVSRPVLHADGSRFTPACAGTGRSPASSSHASAVHPRVRGDRARPIAVPIAASGSPPRARGQGDHLLLGARHARFTPACAGTGVRSVVARQKARFTPACAGTGPHDLEKEAAIRFTPACAGTGVSRPLSRAGVRFTPACAGTGASTRTS